MTSLREMIETFAGRLGRGRRQRRDRAHLMRLDDRLLDDIGVRREEIDILFDRGAAARSQPARRLGGGVHAARLQ